MLRGDRGDILADGEGGSGLAAYDWRERKPGADVGSCGADGITESIRGKRSDAAEGCPGVGADDGLFFVCLGGVGSGNAMGGCLCQQSL